MAVSTRPHRTIRPDTIKPAAEEPFVIASDQALPIDEDRLFYITKGSALAGTLAAPGAVNIGRRLKITTGTGFAHVVTATGGTVRDGTAGGKTTLTSPAAQGATLTLVAVSAALWNVEANNLWVLT